MSVVIVLSVTGAASTITKEQLKGAGNFNLILTIANPSFNIVQNNLLGSDPNSLPSITMRGFYKLAFWNQVESITILKVRDN